MTGYKNITCDVCGKSHTLWGGHNISWSQVRDDAMKVGWKCDKIKEADVCPDCQTDKTRPNVSKSQEKTPREIALSKLTWEEKKLLGLV